ncbi:unnamed protein product [Arabidopsis thaliana]|uniref:(thale cress) hypothetical protein n=1 Tax=Arabidopsis thaliana TaxID=3702 RepID=A0A7G2F0A9_ARATH|nr:unnamed protein product [Arabidopsis thaliana]
MSSLISFNFLFLSSFLTSSFTASAEDPYNLYNYCPKTTNYSSNSIYFTNLKTLLSSLSSRNASYSTGFQNATAGKAPDRVTGLFLCRGDVSPEVCRNCVAFSVNQTLNLFPKAREAVFYYEECILRYSHKNILATLIYEGGLIMQNTNNISSNQKQIDGFTSFVSSTMSEAAGKAANSSRKLYTVNTELTAYQNLYGLLQCTPDLTRQDCLSCLRSSINGMALSRIGARLYWPRSLVSTPPISSSSLPGKTGNSTVLVVAIVVLAVLLFIALVGYCFLGKRTKKTFDTASASQVGDAMATAESLQLNYRTIQTATNDFAESNKIGRGGFGEVYKVYYNIFKYTLHGAQDLLTHAWRLWTNRTALDLVDPLIANNCQNSEVVRCIHIGLLCVQEDPAKRPTISTVFMMLTSNTVTLPVPRQPGFFIQSSPVKDPTDSDQSTTNKSIPASIDDESITDLFPR